MEKKKTEVTVQVTSSMPLHYDAGVTLSPSNFFTTTNLKNKP